MTPAEVLSTARDLLAAKGWWQAGNADSAGGYCALTAVNSAAAAAPFEAHMLSRSLHFLRLALGVDDSDAIPRWNDDPSTTYEDVILALKRAEELAVQA